MSPLASEVISKRGMIVVVATRMTTIVDMPVQGIAIVVDVLSTAKEAILMATGSR